MNPRGIHFRLKYGYIVLVLMVGCGSTQETAFYSSDDAPNAMEMKLSQLGRGICDTNEILILPKRGQNVQSIARRHIKASALMKASPRRVVTRSQQGYDKDPLREHDLFRIEKMAIDDRGSLGEVLAEFNNDADVIWAEPNCRVHINYVPNDPYYPASANPNLWGVREINSEKAWDKSRGTGIVVAVVDTGIAANHEDLIDNVWNNPDEIPANGVDDDNNGFIDDIRGWNFVANNGNPNDDNEHGSHVAGTIAAMANNGKGVVGVAFESKIMAVKGLDAAGGGALADIIDGIYYAVDNGAHVINASFGGEGNATCVAVNYATSKNVVFVAAAGNENQSTSNVSPGGCAGAFSVAALNTARQKCSFSNFGPEVMVAAPGCGPSILSVQNTGGYVALQGTSMAAPHVAGVAALVLSAGARKLTAMAAQQAIIGSAIDLGTVGRDDIFGYGLPDAEKAVDEAIRVSGQAAPVIGVSQTEYNAYVGEQFMIGVQASDSNKDALTYSIKDDGGIDGSLDSSTGVFTWTPSQVQDATVELEVSDGFASNSVSFQIHATLRPKPTEQKGSNNSNSDTSTAALGAVNDPISYASCESRGRSGQEICIFMGILLTVTAFKRRRLHK